MILGIAEIAVVAQARQESYIEENYDCAIPYHVPPQTEEECAEYREDTTIEKYARYNRVAPRNQERGDEWFGLSLDIHRLETNTVH